MYQTLIFSGMLAIALVLIVHFWYRAKRFSEEIRLGWENLQVGIPNLKQLCISGIDPGMAAFIIAERIAEMVRSRSTVKSVLDYCDSIGITYPVGRIIGALSPEDEIRESIHKRLQSALNGEDIKKWVHSHDENEDEWKRIPCSIFHLKQKAESETQKFEMSAVQ